MYIYIYTYILLLIFIRFMSLMTKLSIGSKYYRPLIQAVQALLLRGKKKTAKGGSAKKEVWEAKKEVCWLQQNYPPNLSLVLGL